MRTDLAMLRFVLCLCLCLCLCLLSVASCKGGDSNAPEDSAYQWKNLDFPRAISFGMLGPDRAGLALWPRQEGAGVLVAATSDGLYRNDLSADDGWISTGPDGFRAHSVIHLQEPQEMLLAVGSFDDGTDQVPIMRSFDEGKSWIPATSLPYDDLANRHVAVSGPVQSAHDPMILYADGGGGAVLVSTDAGATWAYENELTEPWGNSDCRMASAVWEQDALFQGCEVPLEMSWIARRALDATDDYAIGEPKILVDSYDQGVPVLEYRRTNKLVVMPDEPHILYAGIEGRLLRVNTQAHNEYEILYGEHDDGLFVYVTQIVLDGEDMVFGGFDKGPQLRFSLFHSADGGQTHVDIDPPVPTDLFVSVAGLVPAGERTYFVLLQEVPFDFAEEKKAVSVYRLTLTD